MPYIQSGDLKVNYMDKGEGDPVVFVHGNWGSLSWWEPLIDRLPKGYWGIAYDMRGRNKTEGPDNDYTIPELSADLYAFVGALGLDRFHLVGHSLGTAVVMQAALDDPRRVKTVTAIAPAWVDGMPPAFNLPERQVAFKADPVLFAVSLKALAPGIPEDDYWKRLVQEGFSQRIEAAVRNLPALVDWHPGDTLRETGIPALVIVGTADPLTGGNADRAAMALGAKLVVMEGIGHSPNVEAPDEVMKHLLDLFATAKE